MIPRISWLVFVTMFALALEAGVPAHAQAPAPAKPEAPAAAKPAPSAKPAVVPPKSFASAEEATQALVAALRAGDTKALLGILGSESRALVSSGGAVADKQSREKFLSAYDGANKLVPSGNSTVLQVGSDNWPFPIPLVKDGERWRFDPEQGREEILARRIGRNELYTIETCLAYVDAQRDYYSEDRNADGIREYAQQFASTPGKRDGLYWLTRPDEPLSPLGSLVVRARADGYRRDHSGGPTPRRGHLYRLLPAHGADPARRQSHYVVRGLSDRGWTPLA